MVTLLSALTLPTTIIIIGLEKADILMVKDVTAYFLRNNLNCFKKIVLPYGSQKEMC